MKMFPPPGVPIDTIAGFGRPYDDGSFEVPQSRVFEMVRVHNWRKDGDTRPVTRQAFDEQEERHRRELAAKDDEIGRLQAENQTIMTTNGVLNAQIRDLAAKLGNPRPAPKATPETAPKKPFK